MLHLSLRSGLEALTGPQEPLYAMRIEFKKRRDYMVSRLNEMPGFQCLTPPGAFYVYPDVSEIIGKTLSGKRVTNDDVLAEISLEDADRSSPR